MSEKNGLGFGLTDEQVAQLNASTQRLYGTPAAEVMTAMAGQHRLLEKGGHRLPVPSRGLGAPLFAMGGKLRSPLASSRHGVVPELADLEAYNRLCSAETTPREIQVTARIFWKGEADDQVLNRHCAEVRRRFAIEERLVVGVTMDWMTWDFPTFAPRARPFDWTFDEGL